MDTTTSTASSASSLLLALPEPLLLAVLQCLAAAGDQRSLFSAARAHSRLHQAAVVALSSITADVHTQQADALLPYLDRHGQHISSMNLCGDESSADHELMTAGPFALRHLPGSMQLRRLCCDEVRLQLLAGHGFPGVLGAAAVTLTHLQLSDCLLLDGAEGLAEALLLLPELEHLDLTACRRPVLEDDTLGDCFSFSTGVLAHLQQLTYLALDIALEGAHGSPALQPLSALTRLADLQLRFCDAEDRTITPSMVPSTRLTSLVIMILHPDYGKITFEPAVLAGKTQLQHLMLSGPQASPAGAAGAAQLLLQLQSLQQLTCLHLEDGIVWENGRLQAPGRRLPAADLSALTASSMLQHLELCHCVLPAGAWEHVFPPGRQLPHLTWLSLLGINQPSGPQAAAPACSRLVMCCPGLQVLHMAVLQYSTELLAPLSGLSSLRELLLTATKHVHWDWLEVIPRMTALRELHLDVPVDSSPRGLLLQLTALKCLERLTYQGPIDGVKDRLWLISRAPGADPVWRQLLQHHLSHSDPAVAQQAAAALAE